MHDSEQDRNHREEASQNLSNEGRKYFKLIEFDVDEELITEIRKHKFGLFIILAIGSFTLLLLLAISISASLVNLNELLGLGDLNGLRGLIIAVLFILMIGTVFVTGISVFLYISNVIFVTSEKLAQVIYVSLFNRKISQLSIGDVQDVTVKQKGIFAHIFNYGTLIVETAGEQQNYTFTFVPDPYKAAQQIVGTHERNLVAHGN